MKYSKALILSFLFHGIVFAGVVSGTYTSLVNYIFEKKKTLPKQGYLNVEFYPAVEPAISKEKPILPLPLSKQKVPQKKALKTLHTHPSFVETGQENLSYSESKEASSGEDDLIPYSNNKLPDYPEEARRLGLKGKMVMELTVNPYGKVEAVSIQSGEETPSILKKLIVEAVKNWRFRRSKSTTEKVILPIEFHLEE